MKTNYLQILGREQLYRQNGLPNELNQIIESYCLALDDLNQSPISQRQMKAILVQFNTEWEGESDRKPLIIS